MTSVYVTKKNKKKQLFNKGKIARACVKAGVSKEAALGIAKAVESKISCVDSKVIAKLVVAMLRKKSPQAARAFASYRKKKK